MATLLDPATVRADAILEVDLGDDQYVRARRLDLTQMIFEGLLPQPIMAAAQRLLDSRGQSAAAQLGEDDAADKAAQLEALRHHAVVVVLEPRLVRHEDHNPTHLHVELLTFKQLLAIWNQTAVIPRVSAAQAATFRGDVRRRPLAPLSARQDVWPRAQPVARVEFRGA